MEQESSIVPSDKGKQIVTEPEEVNLGSLKESDIGKILHVKVYRKWTPTNQQGKPVVFCCMLLDKQVQHVIL